MSVYFITAKAAKTVKIGTAKDIWSRLAELQVGHHEPLALLALLDGGREVEKEIHRRFKADHIRGEWFRLTDEVLKFASNFPPPVAARAAKIESVKKAAAIWFDGAIQSDRAAAAKAGFSRILMKSVLGPSGRKSQKKPDTEQARAMQAKSVKARKDDGRVSARDAAHMWKQSPDLSNEEIAEATGWPWRTLHNKFGSRGLPRGRRAKGKAAKRKRK